MDDYKTLLTNLSLCKYSPCISVSAWRGLDNAHAEDAGDVEDTWHVSQLVGIDELLGNFVHVCISEVTRPSYLVVCGWVGNLNIYLKWNHQAATDCE